MFLHQPTKNRRAMMQFQNRQCSVQGTVGYVLCKVQRSARIMAANFKCPPPHSHDALACECDVDLSALGHDQVAEYSEVRIREGVARFECAGQTPFDRGMRSPFSSNILPTGYYRASSKSSFFRENCYSHAQGSELMHLSNSLTAREETY